MSTPIPSEQYGSYEREFLSEMLQREVFSSFAAAVQHRRNTSDLTQADLAKRTAMDKSRVSKLLNFHGNWQLDTISSFANALELDIHFLLTDRTDPSRGFVSTGTVHISHPTSRPTGLVAVGSGWEARQSRSFSGQIPTPSTALQPMIEPGQVLTPQTIVGNGKRASGQDVT